MMPLSFAALISGMTTLVASPPNLVVNSEIIRQGETGFRFFAFTPFGVPILVLGILYMVVARHWLPAGNGRGTRDSSRPSLIDWVAKYKLANRQYRLRVTEGSLLVGQSLQELKLHDSGAYVIAIERPRGSTTVFLRASGSTVILTGDILIMDVLVPGNEVEAFGQRFALEPLILSESFFHEISNVIGMAEVIIPADSTFIGKTIVEAELRTRAGLTVIGLRRGQTAFERSLLKETLQVGDTLLVMGPWKRIKRLRSDESVVLLTLPSGFDNPARQNQGVACGPLSRSRGQSDDLRRRAECSPHGCLLMGLLGSRSE